MAEFYNTTNKQWGVKDGVRSVLGLTGDGGLTLRILQVEDSGEEYFCGGKKWPGWNVMVRELLEATEDGVRLRVSGGDGEAADLFTCDNRELQRLGNGDDFERLAQRWIGKGVDGRPVLRLDIAVAPEPEDPEDPEDP